MIEKELVYSKSTGMNLHPIGDTPALGNQEVLIRPLSVAICGSDLFHLESYSGDNLRLGHEWIGRVVEIGDNTTKIKVGDIVTSTAHWGCGICSFCIEGNNNSCEKPIILSSESMGAIRSWMVAKENNLIPLTIPGGKELVLVEVGAVGLEAIKLLDNKEGEVLIFGAGSVGIFSALVAKKLGMKPVLVEVYKNRVQMGKDLGLNTIFLQELIIDSSFHHHFSSIIDATGDAGLNKGAFQILPKFLKKNGEILIVGKYLENPVVNMKVMNGLGAKMKWMSGVATKRLDEVAQLLSTDWADIFKILVSHEFSMLKSEDAFSIAKKKDCCGKVIIQIEEN